MTENFSEKWIGIEDAARHLGVTKDTVRAWIKKTDIPAHKIGKLWKFILSELDEWVKAARVPLTNLTGVVFMYYLLKYVAMSGKGRLQC